MVARIYPTMRMIAALIVIITTCFKFTSSNIITTTPTTTTATTCPHIKTNHWSTTTIFNDDISIILKLRGGVTKTSRKKKSARSKSLTGKPKVGASTTKPSGFSTLIQKYKSILPLTRLYITMVGIVTILTVLLGDEAAQGLLALDPLRTLYGLQLWRPFTAAAFLGPPSISWLMSTYYLFEYGSSLERAFGTPQHVLFLIGQIILLTTLCSLLGMPFFGNSVITSMLHVLSRSMPHQKVKWLIFTVPYWTLPYGLMMSDVLQAGNPMAALPHILGILTGHVYFFHKFVWPKLGGEDWLVPPDFMVKRLDPNAKVGNEDKVGSSKVRRKRGKGRKLGG